MSLSNIVVPVSKDHSIKEAVIGLFLANPIVNPQSFNELIETKLKNTFQQFQPLQQINIDFRNPIFDETKISKTNNTGFKLVSFDKGKMDKVLQANNEADRTYLSYHSLNYTRWIPYLKDFTDVIKIISEFQGGLFVTAVSLHYIDEFIWNSEEKIDLKKIFNQQADYLPKEFFNSDINNYAIITKKNISNKEYQDRLEVQVQALIKPTITISHNVSQALNEPIDLNKLINSTGFDETLASSHLHNKEILKDILTNEIRELIKLT